MAGDALPTGVGAVAAGQVGISTANGEMTVNQGSDRDVVNWQGFYVGEGNSVNFVQPDVYSAILNRVTGSTGSTIARSLLCNGSSATVSNAGVISIGRGGYVALMCGKVKNDGLVAVSYGKAGFGAGGNVRLSTGCRPIRSRPER